jgi:drug/metabolite transporter (DMT)-like permease
LTNTAEFYLSVLEEFKKGLQLRWGPFYRAWIATIAALIFGLAPIFCAWGRFALHGQFRSRYESTFGNGDALMIATSLAGPALVLAYKRRDPETMKAPQLIGLVGIILLLACIIIFLEAFPVLPDADHIEEHRVIVSTYLLLPVSVLYALWISYLDERSTSMKEFNRNLDTNGSKLQIQFPAGGA